MPLTSHNTPFESPLTTLASLFWLACRNRAKPPLHKLTSTQFLVATGTLIQRSLDPRLTIRKGAFCFLLSPRACHTVTPKDVCSELSDARISAPPTAIYHEAFMSLVSKVLFSRIQTKRVSLKGVKCLCLTSSVSAFISLNRDKTGFAGGFACCVHWCIQAPRIQLMHRPLIKVCRMN